VAVVPREQINYPGALWERDESGESKQLAPADPALHVVWTRDHAHVQVGFEFDRAVMKEHLGHASGEDWIGADRAVFYTGNLNREEINNAIRTLRRARNAAYGADE
jgi:hypothetical protein